RPGAQRLDEAARLVDVGEAVDDLVAAQDAERLEVGAGGRQGGEGVRLLPQLADGDGDEPSSLGPIRRAPLRQCPPTARTIPLAPGLRCRSPPPPTSRAAVGRRRSGWAGMRPWPWAA